MATLHPALIDGTPGRARLNYRFRPALIGQSTRLGELVLDLFCGSGNTARAARELDRRAQLCDIDTTVAERRLRLTPVSPGYTQT